MAGFREEVVPQSAVPAVLCGAPSPDIQGG
jgi:hypothetical protein